MALLLPGEYKLVEKRKINEKKSMLFVKFTESAHQALEDYLKKQDLYGVSPVIDFNDNSGVLHIPTNLKDASEVENCMVQFTFNIESNVVMQGQQGLFECVQHKNGSQKVCRCGLLTKRLKIHASKDIYETTKNKMTKVHLEQQKICTKEINLNVETVNRRVKINKNSQSMISTDAVKQPSNMIHQKFKVGLQKFAKTRCKTRSNTVTTFNSVAKKPLKQRIIQMLAVKPLKKIELSMALKKDGLSDNDKDRLHGVLTSVAVMKDNVYHLRNYVWNDVLEDWPSYSEFEKRLMRKNKSENLTALSNDKYSPRSPSPSPSPTNISASPSRPGYTRGVDGFQTKRRRISHFQRLDTKNSLSVLEDEKKNLSKMVNHVTPSHNGTVEKSTVTRVRKKRTNKEKNENLEVVADVDTDGVQRLDECGLNVNETKDCDNTSISSQNEMDVELPCLSQQSDESPYSPLTDSSFMNKYVTINNIEQRRQYKNDFHEFHKEYLAEREEMSQLKEDSQQRKELLEKLEGDIPVSPEAAKKYLEELELYREKKQRFQYLVHVLNHIKQLVHDYDSKILKM